MALKTNFTDDILSESMNGKRQYNVTENSNGTKSLEDATDYQSVGSTFSAKNMNETNAAVNQAYDDIGDEFNPEVDYAVGDYTIRNNKIWKFTTAHPAGAWDESHVKATKILSEARELNENLNKKASTGHAYIHDTWYTSEFNANQNKLIIGHSVESGNVAGHFCYLACAAESADNTPKLYKISGDVTPLFNWNNGLSLGIGASSQQWLNVDLIALSN